MIHMKKYLFLTLLVLALTASAQRTFTRTKLDGVSKNFHIKLNEYAGNFGHTLRRNSFLDTCATQRAGYFLSVLEATAKSKNLALWDCGNEIPHSNCKLTPHSKECGKKARQSHKELFGNPDFFVKPQEQYFPGLRDFPDRSLIIESEIMIYVRWQDVMPERQSVQQLLEKVLPDFSERTGSFSGHLLESYKNSDSHRTAIEEDGDGDFGVSTLVLIQEEKTQKGNWRYSVVIYNLVIFTSQIEKLP